MGKTGSGLDSIAPHGRVESQMMDAAKLLLTLIHAESCHTKGYISKVKDGRVT